MWVVRTKPTSLATGKSLNHRGIFPLHDANIFNMNGCPKNYKGNDQENIVFCEIYSVWYLKGKSHDDLTSINSGVNNSIYVVLTEISKTIHFFVVVDWRT